MLGPPEWSSHRAPWGHPFVSPRGTRMQAPSPSPGHPGSDRRQAEEAGLRVTRGEPRWWVQQDQLSREEGRLGRRPAAVIGWCKCRGSKKCPRESDPCWSASIWKLAPGGHRHSGKTHSGHGNTCPVSGRPSFPPAQPGAGPGTRAEVDREEANGPQLPLAPVQYLGLDRHCLEAGPTC